MFLGLFGRLRARGCAWHSDARAHALTRNPRPSAETEAEAARQYDRALIISKGVTAKTNFDIQFYRDEAMRGNARAGEAAGEGGEGGDGVGVAACGATEESPSNSSCSTQLGAGEASQAAMMLAGGWAGSGSTKVIPNLKKILSKMFKSGELELPQKRNNGA